MFRIGAALTLGLCSLGCSGERHLRDTRIPMGPPPADVQAEIRDARYFLASPDDAIGPDTSMGARAVGR